MRSGYVAVIGKANAGELTIDGLNGATLTATGQGVGAIQGAEGTTLVFKNLTIRDESFIVGTTFDRREGYLEFGGKLRFELLAADDPVSADLARYLVQSWQKHLKVYPTLTLLPEAELAQRVNSGNYQAAIYTTTLTGLTGGENLRCFGTGAVGNLSRLSHGQVDAAIAAAQSGGRAPLEALDRLLWQVCPCVPLTTPTRYYSMPADDPLVKGVYVRPFGGGRYGAVLGFKTAYKWD